MNAESEKPDLAPTGKEPSCKPALSVLTCTGEESICDLVRLLILEHLAGTYEVNVTDKHRAADIIEFVQQHRVDLIATMVNNILVGNATGGDRILKAVELLGRLKAQHGVPVVAFSGHFPESFDLVEELARNGIRIFFPAPIEKETLFKGLDAAMSGQRATG